MATGAAITPEARAKWERFGATPDAEVAERVALLEAQGIPIRASLPQSDTVRVGDALPAPLAELLRLDGTPTTLGDEAAAAAAAGKALLLNFGSIT